jgi:hypothetical protein
MINVRNKHPYRGAGLIGARRGDNFVPTPRTKFGTIKVKILLFGAASLAALALATFGRMPRVLGPPPARIAPVNPPAGGVEPNLSPPPAAAPTTLTPVSTNRTLDSMYENRALGFRIRYPEGWHVYVSANGIRFYNYIPSSVSPNEPFADKFKFSLSIAEKNPSLDFYSWVTMRTDKVLSTSETGAVTLTDRKTIGNYSAQVRVTAIGDVLNYVAYLKHPDPRYIVVASSYFAASQDQALFFELLQSLELWQP